MLRERMFREHTISCITNIPDLHEGHLDVETRNVLALNDSAAAAGEDRFFYFSEPHETEYAPSLFVTKAGYGPLIAYEKWIWSEEEKAEYWKHDDAQRYCLMQCELSRIKLEDKVIPLLLLIPADDENYVSWPNDTIAKAFLGIINNEIHLGFRVDWEHVAIICGRRCELFFNTAMDPPSAETDEHSTMTMYQAARNSLTARGTCLHQCFKELRDEATQRDWVPWFELKKLLAEQEHGIQLESEDGQGDLESKGGLIKDWARPEGISGPQEQRNS